MHGIDLGAEGVDKEILRAELLEDLRRDLSNPDSLEFIELTNAEFRSGNFASDKPNGHVGCYPEKQSTFSHCGNGMYIIIDENGKVYLTNRSGARSAQLAGFTEDKNPPISIPYGADQVFRNGVLDKRASARASILMRDTYGWY